MLYRIRPATPEDHDFIYGLKAESVRPYVEKIWGWEEAYQRADFDADFSAIEQFHVVETDGGRAGFVQYNRHHSWELLYKGWFTLPTTLHRLTVHLWQK